MTGAGFKVIACEMCDRVTRVYALEAIGGRVLTDTFDTEGKIPGPLGRRERYLCAACSGWVTLARDKPRFQVKHG